MILKKVVLFLLTTLIISFNSLHATEDSAELEKQIDIPLYEFSQGENFVVEWRNEKGQAVGKAYFQNPLMTKSFESVLWYYDPQEGFSVIMRDSDLHELGEVEFQKILINQNGTLVAQYQSRGITTWFSWSKENGLFYSNEESANQLIDLNTRDYFLIRENLSKNFKIIHAKNPTEEFRVDALQFSFEEVLSNPEFNEGLPMGYNVYYARVSQEYFLNDSLEIIAKMRGRAEIRSRRPNHHPCENGWLVHTVEVSANFMKSINDDWIRTDFY